MDETQTSDQGSGGEVQFQEGRYQLSMVPKVEGGDLQSAVISQSGKLQSQAQLDAWFIAAKGQTIVPETHEWVFHMEGMEAWKDDFGADPHRPKTSQVPEGQTSDPLANVPDGVANLSEANQSLLDGVQNKNPDPDMVLHVQKGIILDQHLKEHDNRVNFAKHMKKFSPTR